MLTHCVLNRDDHFRARYVAGISAGLTQWRRRTFALSQRDGSDQNGQAPGDCVRGVRWSITTGSKFKVRKFWREVMRPPAPVQSGGARGRFEPVSCQAGSAKARCDFSEEAWLHAVNSLGSWRGWRSASNFQKVYYSNGFD